MRFLVLILLAALAWTASRLADVERQRYAMLVGLCELDESNPRPFIECLHTATPRTSPLWDLWYGLTS
jgi:hypothetical protein